jgi:hypothetical protein
MNLSLLAALAFFFGLAAASLAVRLTLDDTVWKERTKRIDSARRPRARSV